MRRSPRVVLALASALYAAASFSSPVEATTAAIDGNGNLVVDGEPFLPIGMYHVSWIGGRQGNAQQVGDFDVIADAGFNLVHPTVDLRPGMAAALDRAAARGMRVIAELPWAAAADVIALWKDRPAMIGWNIADDFNAPYNGPPNHPPAQIVSRRDFVAGLAPEHLTYASGGSFPGFEINAYAGAVGLMGFQSYPIDGQTTPTEYELEENSDDFEYVAAELAGTGQAFVANPQSFRWGGGAFPTPVEARNLLYPAFLNGAKGAIFYTYWGENGVLPDVAPALWSELKREVVELKTLTPFFLHGARAEIATGNPRVHAAQWSYLNQIVAVVVNTHRTDSYGVSLALASATHGPAQTLFPARVEAGMTAVSGLLTGTIGPLEVHVYVVDVEVPGNDSPQAAAVVSPAPLGVGDSVAFDASGSSDADGTVTAWDWDFGDGVLASGQVVAHTYAGAGTYVARLTVRDDDAAPSTLFIPVTVQITSLCPPSPSGTCREATRSNLAIAETATRRTLKWNWKGPATSAMDFGDPRDDSAYALCIYDGGGSVLATATLPSASKWTQTGSGGFRLRDAAGAPGGVTRARLVPGPDGRARISVLAKGAALPDPDLPLTLPVTVQVRRSDGGPCWSAAFTEVQQNTDTRFRARNP